VTDDPRQNFSSPPAGEKAVPARPFPREAYVFGWLVICIVAAEAIHSLISGVLGTGIILICLVPVMVWLMHIRPRHHATRKSQG
jgi:Flp pilus assembly protein TadB